MENVTLEQINKNIILLGVELERIARIVEEQSLELEDDLEFEISESRKKKKFISHEEMIKEFDR